MAEAWLPVPDYVGLYEISDHGRVRSVSRCVARKAGPGDPRGPHTLRLCGALKRQRLSAGYPSVSLCRDGVRRTFRVHALVAAAFLGARPHGAHVRHLDGNPENNCVQNLAYGSPLENASDERRLGRLRTGDRNPSTKICDADLPALSEKRASGMSLRALGREYGVADATILRALSRSGHVAGRAP